MPHLPRRVVLATACVLAGLALAATASRTPRTAVLDRPGCSVAVGTGVEALELRALRSGEPLTALRLDLRPEGKWLSLPGLGSLDARPPFDTHPPLAETLAKDGEGLLLLAAGRFVLPADGSYRLRLDGGDGHVLLALAGSTPTTSSPAHPVVPGGTPVLRTFAEVSGAEGDVLPFSIASSSAAPMRLSVIRMDAGGEIEICAAKVLRRHGED